jgi:energy-coupling factor transporter ATP-binding protein EcfA2
MEYAEAERQQPNNQEIVNLFSDEVEEEPEEVLENRQVPEENMEEVKEPVHVHQTQEVPYTTP